MSEEINERDHIGLVYRVAQELANTDEVCIRAFGKDVCEYLGEGFLALKIAKNNYKPELGWKFSTYATEVIRDRLIQAARRSTLIKVSYQARYQANRHIQGKEVKEGDCQKVKDALRVMHNNILPISEFSEKGRSDNDPEWEVMEELYSRIGELDERSKKVLSMRFGLDNNEPLTLEEVGAKLDPPVTRERVRQIEKEALIKLKDLINM
jgi:RNA polymerase sigma factor (sigma-70 family)